MISLLLSALVSSLAVSSCHAFGVIPPSVSIIKSSSGSALEALSERQMQFWEDVEEGLDDIESFYASKGQSLERIRQFGKSARGEIPPPTGSSPGHLPSEEHIEGLTARPFWNLLEEPDKFPWAAPLQEKSDLIIQEFQTKLQDSQFFASDSAWQTKVMGEGWSAVRLQRLGVWNAENCKEFPETYQLLQQLDIPLAVRGVCFARQAPNSGVQPHSDGRNFILTSHLGLSIPQDCWIKVGNETASWKRGKLTTLDTSFEHSTGNPSTTEERHVLILDFWHPDLSQGERAALEFIYDLRNQFESGRIPYRKPKQLQQEGGLAGLWNTMTGGGGD